MTSDLRSTFGLALLFAAAIAFAWPAAAQQAAPEAPAAAPKPKRPPVRPPRPERPAAPAPATTEAPAAGEVQPTLLATFGDWGAYTASPDGKKVCFALAKPTKSETTPPNRSRDPAFLFVSSRPAEKVKDEVSIIIGYGFKPNTDATLEGKLIEAMRKGGDLTIKGTSSRGTGTIDVFSLKGLAQALDKVGEECR